MQTVSMLFDLYDCLTDVGHCSNSYQGWLEVTELGRTRGALGRYAWRYCWV